MKNVDSPGENPFFLLLFLPFFWVSIYGGMDAWQYWWIKSGHSGYVLKTMTVSSARYYKGYRHSKWVDIQGVIDGTAVHDAIRINSRTQENAYLRFLQPGELVDFYCHGPIQENQNVTLIEASFINSPPNRIWWVPIVSSIGFVFLGIFLFQNLRLWLERRRIRRENKARKKKEYRRRRRERR